MSIATKPKPAVRGKPPVAKQAKPTGKKASAERSAAGPSSVGNAVVSRAAAYTTAPSNQTSNERNLSNSELNATASPARAQGQSIGPAEQPTSVQSNAVDAGAPASPIASAHTLAPTSTAGSVAESSTTAATEKAPKTDAGPSAEMQSVVGEIQAAGAYAREHDSPEKKGAETQKAMGLPAGQAASIAQSQKMSSLASQSPPPFNREEFKKKLHDRIKALQADDAKAIKDGDKANQINQAVKGEVAAGKEAASGGIQQANAQAPTGGPAPIPGKEIPAAANKPASKIDASKAAPQPVHDSKTSLAAESQAIDQKMATAKVTPEQLARSNEPEFQAAADARVNSQAQAASVPAQVRAQEAGVLDQTKSNLVATTATGVGTMHGSRKQSLGAVSDQQIATKAKREATKAKLTTNVNGIYDRVNQAVTDRLKTMDDLVKTTFDDGASAAKTNFNLFLVEELLKYFVGGGWIVDAFTEGNDYKAIFDRGRDAYMNEMDLVIEKVAGVVESAMSEIVVMVQKAKAEIDELITALPEEDRAVGEEVAEGARGKFAELQSTIEQKQQEVIDDIAQKYVTAVKEVDALIDTLKDPVGAIISAAVDMLSGVIETIMKMRELLMSIAAKAGEAIDLILADPIGFLANLIAGVKQGVENFVANIGTYLKAGLLEWLFGALAGAGIKMPEKFDLSGLLSIVLQVLGLTYDNFRKRAVNILGEPTVAAIEKASEIFMILITKGAAGLWEFIQEQATAFLEIVKDGVKSLVIENVIKAGVKWIIGLLNPASAFVKACMAIYDIVSFVISKGVQILEFVNAVVGSILSIAKGTIAPAAQAVEAALAKSVPVAIGFLASLLGLSDISKDIKAVIDKIQAPVNKVIDWLIKKAVQLVKAIGKMFGGGKEKKDLHADLFAQVGARAAATINQSDEEPEKLLPAIENEFKKDGLKGLSLKQDDAGREFVEASINPKKAVCVDGLGISGTVVLVAKVTVGTEHLDSVEEKSSADRTIANNLEHKNLRGAHYQRNVDGEMVKVAEFSSIRQTDERAQPKLFGPSVASLLITRPNQPRNFTIVARNTIERKKNDATIHNFQHAEHQFIMALEAKKDLLPFITQLEIHLTTAPCDLGCVKEITETLEEKLENSQCPKENRKLTFDKLHRYTPKGFVSDALGFFGTVNGESTAPKHKMQPASN